MAEGAYPAVSPIRATAAPLDAQKGVQRLAENVWLLNFQEHPETLAALIDAAVRHQLPYGILQLDPAPQWLPASFDPMTIQDRSGV
jgi:hypothetical protein